MNAKTTQFPIEGDLLFEKKHDFWDICIFFVMSFIITTAYIILIIENGFSQIDIFLHIAGFSFSIGFVFMSILVIGSLKEGIKNETYEGYYFNDKIIFYRISNYVDEIYTEKKSKETLLKEIIELKDKISKEENEKKSINEFSLKVADELLIEQKEKGVLIADNLRKPHKYELKFKRIKYFLSEKKGIKIVTEDEKEDISDSNYFFKEVFLTNKYHGNQSEIVEFLNNRVQDSKSKLH
jgi:hypothetical protein